MAGKVAVCHAMKETGLDGVELAGGGREMMAVAAFGGIR